MSKSAARLDAVDVPASSCAGELASSSESLKGDGELSALGDISLMGVGDTT